MRVSCCAGLDPGSNIGIYYHKLILRRRNGNWREKSSLDHSAFGVNLTNGSLLCFMSCYFLIRLFWSRNLGDCLKLHCISSWLSFSGPWYFVFRAIPGLGNEWRSEAKDRWGASREDVLSFALCEIAKWAVRLEIKQAQRVCDGGQGE